MSQAQVTGSRRSPAVLATVRRIEEALAAVGAVAAAPDAPRMIVDPAAWFAAQKLPPSAATLGTAVGYSLAPYGSVTLQDDAAIARLLAVVCHPDAMVVDHLRRLGCRAVHVPLGCRPAGDDGHQAGTGTQGRDHQLVTFGAPTERRKRIIAAAAPAFEDLRSAHVFQAEPPFPLDDLPAVLASGEVFVDVAPYDGAAPHPAVLLAALEGGTAIVTEALGPLPHGLENSIVRAPHETVCHRGRELALDPGRAAALAAQGLDQWRAASSLADMGRSLAAALDDAAPSTATPTTASRAAAQRPELSHHAAPAPDAPTIVETLRAERARPDAAVRDGVQRILRTLRDFDERLTDLEQPATPATVDVLHQGAPPPDTQVSVLIPCYSAVATLEAALDSVLRAAAGPDAPRTEVVVVDDGSPLDDGALAAAWAADHPELPVTVLRHSRNRGLAAARNTALNNASGEYVLPLDADNMLRPRGLHRLLEAVTGRPDATFAYGILQEFDATGPIGLRGLYPWDRVRLRHGNYIDALALVRRDALTRLGGYTADMPEQGYEDWDLWCRCAAAGKDGVWVPELVASYRVRADSMSADLHLSHVASLADMVQRHPELLG
ncbi:hypothetical protein DSM112329_04919 [Paraconexibacter sp. AEG42_29]|uniref:Glycosyltransferase 2-like domain-containing protein n=1 Tax=Paraconexibacter sp. AEG42_29 TaxID=2997339 RepID=A0AAU7B269_9ACTN